MRTKRFLAGFLSAVLLAASLGTAALAAPASSYSYNGTATTVTQLGINVPQSLTYLGDGVFRASNQTGAINYVSSLKDIKYYFYDFDGNLTYEYDGSMSLGQHFSDGLCKMLLFDPYTGTEKWGYIDKYGNTAIIGQFDDASDFSDGYAAVKVDGLWGYIDTKGELVIPYQYLFCDDFGDGLAFVRTPDYQEYCIDTSGNIVFEIPKEPVDDGIGGTRMIYAYTCIKPFDDGYAMASSSTGKYQYVLLVDRSGNVREIPNVDFTTGTWNTSARFNSGRLPVSAGGYSGVVDINGNLVVPFLYDRIYTYSNGVAPARNNDGLWGLIDTEGNTVVPFEWSFMWEFQGNQLVAQHQSNGRLYLLEVGGSAQPQPEPEPEPEPEPVSNQPSAWAADDVARAVGSSLVPQSLQSGYTQATTRAEFCALAVQLYETVMGREITERASFTDTDDMSVAKMAGLGVVNGVGGGLFDPDAALTREQAATMLSRLAGVMQKPLTAGSAGFADKGSVADWAIEAVGEVEASGIMNGVGDNLFAPADPYTREQSILTMLRLYDFVK